MIDLLVANLAVVIPCPCPFLGLQSLVKLAQAFCALQTLKVCNRVIGAMSGLDSSINAVN